MGFFDLAPFSPEHNIGSSGEVTVHMPQAGRDEFSFAPCPGYSADLYPQIWPKVSSDRPKGIEAWLVPIRPYAGRVWIDLNSLYESECHYAVILNLDGKSVLGSQTFETELRTEPEQNFLTTAGTPRGHLRLHLPKEDQAAREPFALCVTTFVSLPETNAPQDQTTVVREFGGPIFESSLSITDFGKSYSRTVLYFLKEDVVQQVLDGGAL